MMRKPPRASRKLGEASQAVLREPEPATPSPAVPEGGRDLGICILHNKVGLASDSLVLSHLGHSHLTLGKSGT